MSNFTGVCLVTTDVPRLSQFYGRLLDVPVDDDDQFGVVHLAGAQLSIFDARGMDRMAPGSLHQAGAGSLTLELRVPDVDEIHQRVIEQNVPVVKPPTTQPWGRRSTWIRDPDGNIVNLYRSTADVPSPAEIAKRYFSRLFDAGDLGACDDMLAPDYVDHDAPAGTPPGPGATKAYVRELVRSHRHLTVTVQSVAELGDHVALNVTWGGIRDDGTRLNESGLVIMRVDESGRIRERAATYRTAKS